MPEQRSSTQRSGRLTPDRDGISERAVDVLRRTAPLLPEEMQEAFTPLVSPENLAITAGILAAWVASHAVGVGEVVDVGLLAFGLITLGEMALDAGKHLGECFRLTLNAKDAKDLDEAAGHLASAVSMLGVTLFTNLIMKHAARRVPSAKANLVPVPMQRYFALTVEEWLYKIGFRRIAPAQRRNAEKALEFLRKASQSGSGSRSITQRDVQGWLKGMDLSSPVSDAPLNVGTTLIGYMKVKPEVLVKIRANPSRAKDIIAALRPSDVELGRFFTRPGQAIQDLGIGAQNRVYCRFRVNQHIPALQSKVAPIRDIWTVKSSEQVTLSSGRVVTRDKAQLAGGGGTQYLIPNASDLRQNQSGALPALALERIGTNINLAY